jgi:hypothetical protein
MSKTKPPTLWTRCIALGAALALPLLLLGAWALLGLPPSAAAPAPTGSCVNFEGLSPGDTYTVGQAFVDSAVVVTVHPFEWSTGVVYTGGHVLVDDQTMAGGSGWDVQPNNVNLQFSFAAPLTGLRFRFGEYGGNLNMRINGDFRNFSNFTDTHGLTIGGVDVSVANGFGNDAGWVRLSGPIEGFSVGGQELWLDNLCPETDCVDFEDLTFGAVYHVDDSFVDSDVLITVEPFEWFGGIVYTMGHAIVGKGAMAGGWGLDVNANNVNLAFHFDSGVQHDLFFDFGEYGGNLNMAVNGDFRNFGNFQDIDGLTIGGARVKVIGETVYGKGRVFLFGPVHDFSVGGQELWLDNICPGSCCVEFASLPAAGDYTVGDTFFDTGVRFTVVPFRWSDGTIYSGGHAAVSQQHMAGGTGQEVTPNNVNLDVDFGGGVSAMSLLFGEYGGNLNLRVNGDRRNFDHFADIDGATIGGASVSVINGLGNDKGRLALQGTIRSMAVGGQELFIDHICFVRQPRVFLPLVARAP